MKQGLLLFALFAFIHCDGQVKTGKVVWKYPTQNKIVTNPSIDRDYIYYGGEDGNFYCHAIRDGKLIWKYSTGKPIRSSGTIADGKVFFGCEDGNIYAVDARKGTLLWKTPTQPEHSYDLWDYYRSSPVYSNGKLYVGSGDHNVYAFDATSGKIVWHYTTGDVVHADPAVRNDTVYIGSFDGNFYALNGVNGQLLWKFKTVGDRYFPKGEIQKAALVTKDAVYFGSRDFNIYALNRSTGIGLWNMKESGSWIIATPFEKDGTLFFGTSDSHAFYALHAFYGEIQWKAPIPLRSYNTAVAHDTLIFTGCYNGYLYGLDAKTGKVQWTFQTDGSKKNYTTVYDASGHFRKDFVLYGDEATAAAAEQKIMGLGGILSTPVIKDGTLYFGSADGNFYAVKIE